MIRLVQRKDFSRRHRIMAAFNICGFFYFAFMIVMTTYLGTFVMVPLLYGPSSSNTFYHLSAIVFLVANTAGNFIIAMLTDSTITKLYTKSSADEKIIQLREEYPEITFINQKCRICDIRVLPRCHHCILCGICVLKRDHHCFFMCTCIGYHNQKYFIMFCVWQCLAGLYATHIGSLYLTKLYGLKLNSFYNIVSFLPQIIDTW